MTKLDEFIRGCAIRFCEEYESSRTLRPGHDGPHGHEATIVRCACHWLITLCWVAERYGDPIASRVARSLCDVLLERKYRPAQFTHVFRLSAQTDKCNGTIGPAWAIEALVQAGKVLGDERCPALAEELFFMHEFSGALGLWFVRDVDGSRKPTDLTWNHQLWFAATSSEIDWKRRDEIHARIGTFLDMTSQNMETQPDGRIRHRVRDRRNGMRILASAAKREAMRLLSEKARNSPAAKYPSAVWESGYHAFNMHAFAILKNHFGHHALFGSAVISRAIEYMETAEYIADLEENIFGYYYNPPGFEVPYSLYALTPMPRPRWLELATYWVNNQIRRTYDPVRGQLGLNCPDPTTSASRLYEAVRLPTELLSIIEVEC